VVLAHRDVTAAGLADEAKASPRSRPGAPLAAKGPITRQRAAGVPSDASDARFAAHTTSAIGSSQLNTRLPWRVSSAITDTSKDALRSTKW
jgi:hypothetical protein